MRLLAPLRFVMALLAFGTLAEPEERRQGQPQSFLVLLLTNPASEHGEDLRLAERRVRELLFLPGEKEAGRPWYRFGIDTMTLIESGAGPRGTESLSASRGHWGMVESDYARFLTLPRIKLRESRFAELFQPQPRPHQLDLDRTLESSAGDWMTGAPLKLIVLRELTNAPLSAPPLVQARMDRAGNRFQVIPRTQERIGTNYLVETADVLPGHSVKVSTAFHGHGLRNLLALFFRFVLDLAGLAIAGLAARWAWIHRFRTRHFELWIPGFAGAFLLPRLTDGSRANFRARLPRYEGEPAAHLELPSRTIRLLFYFRARLQWDPRIRIDALDPSVTETSLLRLPRFVRFVWVERPAEEGNLSLSIVRPRILGGDDRMDIAVNFLAIARPSSES